MTGKQELADYRYEMMLIEARNWISTLPRERLGSFAVDAELLATHTVHERISVLEDEDLYELAIEGSIASIGEFLGELEYDGVYTRLAARISYEYKMWESMRQAEKRGVEWEPLLSAELDTVYVNPEMLHYFEVGIWNEEFISRCISDGMDAEIALSVYRGDSAKVDK